MLEDTFEHCCQTLLHLKLYGTYIEVYVLDILLVYLQIYLFIKCDDTRSR